MPNVSTSTRPVRYPEFDFMRVLGITGVVCAHTATAFALAPTNSLIHQYVPYAVMLIMSGTMPLFVFMAGYFSSLKPEEKITGAYYRRISRILVPYSLAFLFYATQKYRHEPFAGIKIVGEFLTGSISEHLWFVSIIIQLTLILPFLWGPLRADKQTANRSMAVLAAFHVTACLLLAALPYEVKRPLCLENVINFAAGIYARKHVDLSELDTPRGFAWAMSLFAVATAASLYFLSLKLSPSPLDVYWGHVSMAMVAPLSGLGLLALLRRVWRFLGSPYGFAGLGGCSFGVYLWHLPVLLAVTKAWKIIRVPDYANDPFYYLFAGLLTAAITFGVISAASRTPLRRIVCG